MRKDAAFRPIDKKRFIENPLPHKDVRPLAGKLKGFFRLRVGEFRAIFELDSRNKRIGILAVVPRGKAY